MMNKMYLLSVLSVVLIGSNVHIKAGNGDVFMRLAAVGAVVYMGNDFFQDVKDDRNRVHKKSTAPEDLFKVAKGAALVGCLKYACQGSLKDALVKSCQLSIISGISWMVYNQCILSSHDSKYWPLLLVSLLLKQ